MGRVYSHHSPHSGYVDMSILRVKQLIRERAVRRDRERSERARAETLSRALKRAGLTLGVSTESEKRALREYIDDLISLRDEMISDYSEVPGINDAVGRIDVEMSRALRKLTQLSMEQIR